MAKTSVACPKTNNANGTLYIVSTPIGNLEDITIRALKILKEVDIIAAEDTRHSLRLLTHYGIKKRLISCWSKTEKRVSGEILSSLKSGFDVALITDAGTPCISDPGFYIVKEAINNDIRVVPIPGCSALLCALSASGIPAHEFIFVGFLPNRQSERREKLEELSKDKRPILFYEAPHRLIQTLMDMQAIFGDRYIVVAKEMTKIHEEFLRGKVSDVIQHLNNQKIAGEYVIIAEGKTKDDVEIEPLVKEAIYLMKEGSSRKEASRIIARKYGIRAKEIYDKTIERT